MKQRIINYLLKNLLNAVTLQDIIRSDQKTGAIYVDDKVMSLDDIKQCKAEIKAMEGFKVWKLMSETTKSLAEEKLFNQAKTLEDMNFGKAMLYNLSLQKSIMKVIKNKNM